MPNRRAFMKFVASSPLFASVPLITEALAQQAPPSLVDKAADAVDVFDFELVAKKVLPPAHWVVVTPVNVVMIPVRASIRRTTLVVALVAT